MQGDLQTYIKELEAQNLALKEALVAEQRKIEELPEDSQAMLADLNQHRNVIDFWKIQAQVAEKDKEQALKNIQKEKEEYARNAMARVAQLEAELMESHTSHKAQVFELRKACLDKDEKFQQLQADYDALEAEERAFVAQFTDLTSTMDAQVGDTNTMYNLQSLRSAQENTIKNTIISEFRPLARHYQASQRIIAIFLDIFRQLMSGAKIPCVPQDLKAALATARTSQEEFEVLRGVFEGEHDDDPVLSLLSSMSASATGLQDSLEGIAGDLEKLLPVFGENPSLLSSLMHKLGRVKSRRYLK